MARSKPYKDIHGREWAWPKSGKGRDSWSVPPMNKPTHTLWRTIKTEPHIVRMLGPVEAWRTRICESCGQVKYTWSQTVLRFSKLVSPGQWIHWSKPVKELPEKVLRCPAPVIKCRCPGSDGMPRPSVIDAVMGDIKRVRPRGRL